MTLSDGPRISQDDFLRIIAESRPNLFGDHNAHSEEATLLKKAWYSHMLLALEKLNTNTDKLSTEIHATREDLYREIVSAKELMRKEMLDSCKGGQGELERLENRLVKVQDLISNKVDALEKSPLNIEMEKEFSKMKESIDEKLAPIRDDIIIVKTKFAILAGIFGAAGSGVFVLLEKLFPYIIKIFGS